MLFILIVSCDEKEERKSNINVNSLTGKWWEIKCIAVDQSNGYMTVLGGLDFGKFRFNTDGTWTRQTDEPQLAICNPVDSTFTFIINSDSGTGVYGIPYGDIINLYDSSWVVTGKNIVINNWAYWNVVDQEISEITFTSSRTNYLYRYTMIAE
jgi:hypothetical protein